MNLPYAVHLQNMISLRILIIILSFVSSLGERVILSNRYHVPSGYDQVETPAPETEFNFTIFLKQSNLKVEILLFMFIRNRS